MVPSNPVLVYSFEAGIAQTAMLPLLLALFATVLVLSIVKLGSDRRYKNFGKSALPIIYAAVLPFLIITSLGPAILSLVGLWDRASNFELDVMFFKTELASGALALRLASFFIAYHVIRLETQRLKRIFGAEGSSPWELKDENKDHVIVAETQYLFYGIVAAALWYTLIAGKSGVPAAIASWGLIYILDDWTVMQEYMLIRKCLPTSWLYWKIFIFNILLLVCVGQMYMVAGAMMYILFFTLPIICVAPFWLRNYLKLRVSYSRDYNRPI
nr:hypothetical protein [uncultured Noviherbaspirillum sp.]